MRKNSFGKERLRVYETYKIRALNTESLLNTLVRRGVTVEKAEKKDAKTLLITLKFSEKQKFFAITRELCYTDIEKVKTSGRDKPLSYLLRNFGLIIGAAVFLALAVFAGDFVFSKEYTGSGKILKREIDGYLSSVGVKELSRFSSLDLDRLADGILMSNPRLSFVSCTKRGNRLVIDSALSEKEKDVLTGGVKELRAEEDGIIESIKVYRGEAKVKAGDAVKKGDLIADGTATVGENRVFVGVIAKVSLKIKRTFTYYSEKEGEEKLCLMLAEARLGDDPAEAFVTVSEDENGFVYTAELYYLRTVVAG